MSICLNDQYFCIFVLFFSISSLLNVNVVDAVNKYNYYYILLSGLVKTTSWFGVNEYEIEEKRTCLTVSRWFCFYSLEAPGESNKDGNPHLLRLQRSSPL